MFQKPTKGLCPRRVWMTAHPAELGGCWCGKCTLQSSDASIHQVICSPLSLNSEHPSWAQSNPVSRQLWGKAELLGHCATSTSRGASASGPKNQDCTHRIEDLPTSFSPTFTPFHAHTYTHPHMHAQKLSHSLKMAHYIQIWICSTMFHGA